MRLCKAILITILIISFLFFISAMVYFLFIERINMNVSLHIPTDRLPIYGGKSTHLVKANFVYSNESFKKCDSLCFLIREGKLVNFTRTFKGLSFTGDFVNLTEDKTTIIERIKKGEFIVLAPDDSMLYPMSGLGNVEIFGYDLVYYSCSEYACKKAKNLYFPAYVLYAKSSNYGDVRILVWATSKLIYKFFP